MTGWLKRFWLWIFGSRDERNGTDFGPQLDRLFSGLERDSARLVEEAIAGFERQWNQTGH